MKKHIKISMKKQMSLFLAGTLVASNAIPAVGNELTTRESVAVEDSLLNDGEFSYTTGSAIEVTTPGAIEIEQFPGQDVTYEYNFNTSPDSCNIPTDGTTIETVYSQDGLLTINGNGTMKYNGTQHGIEVKNGNNFEVKVAGNAIITFEVCQYGNGGNIKASANTGEFSKDSVPIKSSADGEKVSIIYKGEPTTLTFTVEGSGYVHSLKVENTSQDIDITQWEAKDFSLLVGGVKIDLTGALTEDTDASAKVSEGDIYYAQSKKAYVSIDLQGKNLTTALLQNNSEETVESLDINANGEIVVTFKDQTTYPHSYTIKVQDKSLFEAPTVTGVYKFDFINKALPADFTRNNPVQSHYTTDNGILTITKGNGSAPWDHNNGHGIAIYNDNYFDIAVAGDATITFDICEHSKTGSWDVSNLAAGGTGDFDSNETKGNSCSDEIVYTYTGEPTVLRFMLNTGGTNYLHGITVQNTGKLEESDVARPQVAMPKEIDSSDSLSVTPNGHRLIFNHQNASSRIDTLQNVGYYVFDATPDVHTIEADMLITPLASGGNNGVFVGMFDDLSTISQIATVGFRGDTTVRNIFTKAGQSTNSAGGINTKFDSSQTVHVMTNKTPEGWYSEFVQGNGEIFVRNYKYTDTELLKTNGINTNVRYGFAFSNVNVVVTNLVFKDKEGNILYDQTDAYDALGMAPNVYEVYQPVVSEDRTTLIVNWEGDKCIDDGAYQVELSKDGGTTYTVLSKQVTERTYTTTIDGDGEYVFRITGVCGSEVTESKVSPSILIVAPLDTPLLAAESGDAAITLSWKEVQEATCYEVYRKTAEEIEYTLVETVEGTSYTDRAVLNEEPYYYYIVAKSKTNESNASNVLLMVPSAGREGKYVYEDQATEIFITKKSYDTVYQNTATVEGRVDTAGTLVLEVNGIVQDTVEVQKNSHFAFKAHLTEGRNDVNVLLTDKQGKVTRRTFNFVYLTNYDKVVDITYTGVNGEVDPSTGARMYQTVQAAVDSVPMDNKERQVILVKEGNYKEYLRVSSPYITLIGEDREKVNINYEDKATVGGDTTARAAIHIKSSATGFAAENLTFENTYEYLGDGSISNESADAVRVEADQSTFVNIKFLGYQDTLQAHSNKQYYYKCYIAGNVDYIYGGAQALFRECELVFRYNANKNSGYITAPNTVVAQDYGYIFEECVVYAEPGCSGSKYLLARPWGAAGAATFINTYMGNVITKSEVYADMSGNSYENARFSEYYSYGPGYAINSKRPQISKTQAENMLKPSALGWNPQEVSYSVGTSDFVGSVVTVGEEKFVETEYNTDKADPDSTDDTGLGAFVLEGYAENVTGGGVLLETAQSYYKVDTAEAFLDALTAIKKAGTPSVVELTGDINLGSLEIADIAAKYSSNLIKPVTNQPLVHPTLLKTGVSTLYLKDMSNLTIYSKNGSAIKHACIDISNSSNIIIRNIVFDELWEWDEATKGDYDRNDWDYMTIQNGSTDIWIDHCTFYKAYDGVIDLKKAESSRATNVTISWSRFLPESESTFFDDMMNELEVHSSQYPYYSELLTEYGMTKEQVRAYAAAQKKTHLVGASETEANMENLQLTLANNYYKNSMDRMPRMRAGNAHVYNCILDASEVYDLKQSIANPKAAQKVVSNGAIATTKGSVLLENTFINGILNPLISTNGSSPNGYINAINSVYYLDGEQAELVIKDLVNGVIAPAEHILDADEFISKMPYSNYKLYNVTTLDAKVLPNTGAGVVDMNSIQWQKTSYNDASNDQEDIGQEYMIAFDYQGATGNNEVAQMKVTQGKAYGKLPVPTRRGYKFVGWYTELTDGVRITDESIVTKEEEHTLYARWNKQSSDDDSDSNSGQTTPGQGNQEQDTVEPEITTPELNIPSDITIEDFSDVSGHWAEEAIAYVIEKGILKGVSDGEFKPNEAMTRSMFATVLYRLAQEPEVIGENGFIDVKSDAWYETAITWASQSGIINGLGDNRFDPNAGVTREQIATMLYKFIKTMGHEVEISNEEISFTDQNMISTWAQEAMMFVAQAGIMVGDENNNCNPKAEATRAEVATMLQRVLEKIEK